MAFRRVCALRSIVDTHTLAVDWDGETRQVRLINVNPESGITGGAFRSTSLGRQALKWARESIFNDVGEVELEQVANEPPLSNDGHLLAYVWSRGECYNVKLVREGYAACFCKYGHPRGHLAEMHQAEHWARRECLGIWGEPNAEATYALSHWWMIRAGQVESYRRAAEKCEDILDARLHHDDIISRARVHAEVVVFADLRGHFELSDGAILLQLGNPRLPLCAFFAPMMAPLAKFLVRHHLGPGKPNYLYFTGVPTVEADQPQLNIESPRQISTYPPVTTHDEK